MFTVQVEFEVTVKVAIPALEVSSTFEGVTVRVGSAPTCVTVTVTLGSPATDTVIVATRCAVSMFA